MFAKNEDFILLDHAIKNCKILVQKGYELVMITNQGGIAKQMYTEADLKEMHQILLDEYAYPRHSISGHLLLPSPFNYRKLFM